MIDMKKLEAVRKIIVHGPGCADGVASAIVLRDVLPKAEIVFCNYGTQAHRELAAEPGLLFADFSPPAERVREFVDAGAIVLDHHKTARAAVEAFGENGVFGDEETQSGVCGATLAFEHVWSRFAFDVYGGGTGFFEAKRTACAFAALAGVRDTWQRGDPRWREACAQREMLLFFEDWLSHAGFLFSCSRVVPTLLEERMAFGRALLRKHERDVSEAACKAWRFTSAKGTSVSVFQDIRLSSDVAEVLTGDLVVAFSYECDAGVPKMILSTRSRGSFDCAAFCKELGGGGHTKAAGVTLPLAARSLIDVCGDPYEVVRELVDGWEAQAR